MTPADEVALPIEMTTSHIATAAYSPSVPTRHFDLQSTVPQGAGARAFAAGLPQPYGFNVGSH